MSRVGCVRGYFREGATLESEMLDACVCLVSRCAWWGPRTDLSATQIVNEVLAWLAEGG